MTEKSETKRNSNKGRLRMVALSETFPAIIVWPATSELVVLYHRQQLWSDLKKDWVWIRPNPWLPKALMHWFLVMQSSALVSSSRRGGVVFFNWDTWGPPRSLPCNTPKTYTNNTKHTLQTLFQYHILCQPLKSTRVWNTCLFSKWEKNRPRVLSALTAFYISDNDKFTQNQL